MPSSRPVASLGLGLQRRSSRGGTWRAVIVTGPLVWGSTSMAAFALLVMLGMAVVILIVGGAVLAFFDAAGKMLGERTGLLIALANVSACRRQSLWPGRRSVTCRLEGSWRRRAGAGDCRRRDRVGCCNAAGVNRRRAAVDRGVGGALVEISLPRSVPLFQALLLLMIEGIALVLEPLDDVDG